MVEKDRSLESFVDAGFENLEPLLYFRDWLVAIRNDRKRRMRERRNGSVTLLADGTEVPGPFTFETRREILKKLLEIQEETQRKLISQQEIDKIHQIWSEDRAQEAMRAIASVKSACGDGK